MKIAIDISAEEFEKKFSETIPVKSNKTTKFYGKAKEGTFTFRSTERTDSLIKGTYSDSNEGCTLEYDFVKPAFDKVFWAVYIAITAFFALALVSSYALFSLLSALIMVFGIICMLVKPKKFQKNLETSFLALMGNSSSEETNDTKESKTAAETEEKTEEEAKVEETTEQQAEDDKEVKPE